MIPHPDPRREIKAAIDQGNTRWLLERAGELHGHHCPGLASGVRAAYRAVRDLGLHSTGMEEIIAIVETNNCFSDGVQFVTGCSFGNNALIFRDLGKTAFTLAKRTGEGVRVCLTADFDTLAERHPGAIALFQKVVVNRAGTPEEQARLPILWRELSFSLLDPPDEALFKVQRVKIEVPAYARIFPSVRCSICGENVMETRIQMKDGKPVCLPCSGGAYGELAGDGIEIRRNI